MFFDFLPVDLLLKIFHQLPFKDRVRLSGVNRSFSDASEESIAKMKSMVVNDDLMAYLVRTNSVTILSLLESCSPTLESIDATSINLAAFHSSQVSALAEFVYPKLKHLKIAVRHPTDNGHVKRLISRNRYLRSVDLHLDIKFEWPEDIIFEKMEKVDIRLRRNGIDLSPTVGPLIGMVPNLKHLTIQSVDHGFKLSAQDFSQLLTSIPSLEELNLDLSQAFGNTANFETAIPTWNLPKLTTLYVNLNCQYSSSVLHQFPVSFPRLQSFTSDTIPTIYKQALKALSQLKHLRELRLTKMEMSTTEIIGVITSLPSVSTLEIQCLLFYPEALIEFLTSTAAIFRRNLEICMAMCYVDGSKSELEDVLEEMKKNGGPSVTYYRASMNSLCIESIRYKSFDG